VASPACDAGPNRTGDEGRRLYAIGTDLGGIIAAMAIVMARCSDRPELWNPG